MYVFSAELFNFIMTFFMIVKFILNDSYGSLQLTICNIQFRNKFKCNFKQLRKFFRKFSKCEQLRDVVNLFVVYFPIAFLLLSLFLLLPIINQQKKHIVL